MSAAKVWTNGAWKTVDTKGSPGDIGNTGAAGTNTLTATGMTFGTTLSNVANGYYEPTGLAASGATSAAPCMTVSGGQRLAAVLAGMYAIALFIDLSTTASVGDGGNWFIIARMVADAGGNSTLGSGDIPSGTISSSTNAVAWLSAGEAIYFGIQKITAVNCNIKFEIRAVMLQ